MLKDIAGIVKTETQNRKAIYKVLKMDKVPDRGKVLLAFLGHPRFTNMFKKDHPNTEVFVIENQELNWLYDEIDNVSLVNPVNINQIKETLKDMKFDYIIMNPPYNGNLHLKILEEAMKHSDNVVNLSPVRWLQDPFKEYKNTQYKKYGPDILKHLSKLEVIPTTKAFELFHAQMVNLGVYYFDMTKTSNYIYKTERDDIYKKVTSYMWTHQVPLEENKQDGWRVKWPKASSKMPGGGKGGINQKSAGDWYFKTLRYFKDGMKEGKPWYEFYNKNKYSKTTPYITVSIPFKTEEEAKNFCDSMNTYFGIFCQENFITNEATAPYQVPWMEDYSEPWTDERFFEFFKLTKEEREYIIDFVDNWYEKYR